MNKNIQVPVIGKILTSKNRIPSWAYPSFYFKLPRKLKKSYKKKGRLK